MKKVVLAILLLLFAIPVSAITVKEAVETFYIDSAPAVVLGDQLDQDDTLAAIAFQNEFGVKSQTIASNFDESKTQVIIGGPCANPVWETLSPSDTCEGWDQPEHRALIVTIESDGATIILIGGTTGKDTRAAAKEIVDNFGNAVFNKGRVVLNVEGLPLAKDSLKVYQTAGTVAAGSGQSSAAGEVIIEIENDASGGTLDLADGLESYIKKSYPYASVTILERDDITLNTLAGKIFIKLGDPSLISVEKEAPSAHVVIAAGAAFWIAGQGLGVNADTTHNQLIDQDLDY